MNQRSEEPVLRTADLVAGYQVRRGLLGRRAEVAAVAGVNLTVREGETVCLVGESGCGKSTLARSVVGLLRPRSGTVLVAGKDTAKLDRAGRLELRKNVQMVFQDPFASLNPRMTAGELIAEGWRVHPGLVAESDRQAEVARLLAQVGLNPKHAGRYPHQFSGGQRQRISIARALAVRPRLIICDEAVSALDVSIQAQILALLAQLQEELGIAYLFITHDLGVVRQIADRVAVMHLGQIVETGTAEEIYQQPRHPYTQALLSAAPSVDDWTDDYTEGIVLQGDTPSPADPPSGCRFRTRCWLAEPRCATETPELAERGGPHLVACHFARPTVPT
ncbi:peptide/nickel transport system ATP-binding protein/oligopeptide transport system ATP-binding protein [Tamaricihabitans halophyticus]|uniref:Peptide/nickel transport system ATP-binding protein/oligopeptide transport system ATP-binding protein n=1 Tax=Tamaricihabitans halophyticus TaxID=1262583 RepID=A0A4R2QDU4_9PSEU|nr:oligopeptide/dipeptide ABC transporter ATP-binding protein [Tamaricihabitans halophyticus]TCP47232.1 peptide/nickel transport system ATP-binding protein/oligopeptide transport system ATP-binding protein [Tamaricihabitans halophyticus]